MRELPISDLVLDFELYPRANVDSTHVHYMVEALRAGAVLPPVVIDKKSKRVTDGFHRVKAKQRFAGDDAIIAVEEHQYPNDKALFLDAMRRNAAHGRTLNRFDRAHCILRAERFRISVEQVASALQLTVDAVGELRSDRVGALRVGKTPAQAVPLKHTIRHMRGRRLNKGQQEANRKLGGMNQVFYANQLILLARNELLDLEDDRLIEKLRELHELLEGILAAK